MLTPAMESASSILAQSDPYILSESCGIFALLSRPYIWISNGREIGKAAPGVSAIQRLLHSAACTVPPEDM